MIGLRPVASASGHSFVGGGLTPQLLVAVWLT
jgi:hypothetical protein